MSWESVSTCQFLIILKQVIDGISDTRLRKLDDPNGPFSAILVATAGLVRIDMAHRITKRLSPSDFPYAVGQGALGIEIREGDAQTLSMIRPIEDRLVRKICLAERSLLRTLQGGCSSPVAVYCTPGTPESTTSPRLKLEGMIIHPHGTQQVSASSSADVGTDEDAEVLGATVARLLEEGGGRDLLQAIALLYEGP